MTAIPYMSTPLVYLALCKGHVVGMRGMYGAQWQIGQPCRTVLGPCAGDVVIDPAHRNRNLFTKMTEAAMAALAEQGYPYAFNLSAGATTHLGLLAMGWRRIGSLQRVYRRPDHGFLQVPNRRISVQKQPRPEAMAELVRRIGHDGRMRHVRDAPYFAWRFQNPFSRYRFLFWEESSLEGYLVLRTSVLGDDGWVSIVDWEAAHEQVRADLLHAALPWGISAKLELWTATLTEATRSLLRQNQFLHQRAENRVTHYRPTVLVRSVQGDELPTDWRLENRSVLELANWDLRMLYSDAY